MTVTDDKGKVIHTERRKYENWNLWFEGGKKVELRLWDITATTSVNMGLEPGETSEETHVLLVDQDTKSVNIDVKFLFEPEPDKWETIKTVNKTVEFHSADKYYEE
ncbi:MAG TPA: hypothetical protein DDX85_03065 [Nitrospiraceae bacterium]|nr:hypothetical protein [Nitrospiraceae bacterium]